MENAGSHEAAADIAATERDGEKARPSRRLNFLASADALRRAAYIATGALAVGFVFWWLQFST
ncbi:MAG TPA: hypothetical protein VGB05_06620, partial [Pyrinomonadaceae bacterium]